MNSTTVSPLPRILGRLALVAAISLLVGVSSLTAAEVVRTYGKVIDGFGAHETLAEESAKRLAQAPVSTLEYGLLRAETLEVKVRYEP